MFADQLLVNILSNVLLAPGASTTVPHGLKVRGKGVTPTQVICDRPGTIAVTGVDSFGVTFTNIGYATASATFRAEYDHSICAEGALPISWKGWDGTAVPAGPAGGDLRGTYPAPTVAGLQGHPIDDAAPVANDFLRYDGAIWRHTLITPGSPVAIYGCFSSTTDQPLGTGLNLVTFDTVEAANGVTLSAGTKLTVTEPGVYAVNLSPQLFHSGGGVETIFFWLRIDGATVPNSASSLEMGNNNNRSLPFFEQTLPLNAGQYIEWAFTSSTGTNISLEQFPGAGIVPANPSVVANVKRIGSKP